MWLLRNVELKYATSIFSFRCICSFSFHLHTILRLYILKNAVHLLTMHHFHRIISLRCRRDVTAAARADVRLWRRSCAGEADESRTAQKLVFLQLNCCSSPAAPRRKWSSALLLELIASLHCFRLWLKSRPTALACSAAYYCRIISRSPASFINCFWSNVNRLENWDIYDV